MPSRLGGDVVRYPPGNEASRSWLVSQLIELRSGAPATRRDNLMASRPHPSRLHPATGAWMPGRPFGTRKLFSFALDRPFALDGGTTLHGVQLQLLDNPHA